MTSWSIVIMETVADEPITRRLTLIVARRRQMTRISCLLMLIVVITTLGGRLPGSRL